MEFEITLIKDSPFPKRFTGEVDFKFKVNAREPDFEKPISELEKEY